MTTSAVSPVSGSTMIPGDVHEALEDVDVPVYAYDAQGVIRWLNPAARRLVGDVRGRQFTSVVAPEDTRRAREAFARMVYGGERHTEGPVVLVARDGGRARVEISSAPLREGGRVVGVFGIVTEEVRTPVPEPPPHLTPRQVQVLHLLAHGRTTHEIAADLHLTVHTVRNHIRHLLAALDAHSRLEALAIARRDGLLGG